MRENLARKEWTVKDHLDGKPAFTVSLYHRFIHLVRECGPFEYLVSKTTITLKGPQRGFAGARPTAKRLEGYLDLQRALKDPRINNTSQFSKRLFVNHFRITDPAQLDDKFAGWVREAYGLGQGAHLQTEIGAINSRSERQSKERR